MNQSLIFQSLLTIKKLSIVLVKSSYKMWHWTKYQYVPIYG